MDQDVKNYILKEKESILISLGLYNKEYSDVWSDEYKEKDKSLTPPKYFKKVVNNVSDEELYQIYYLAQLKKTITPIFPEYVIDTFDNSYNNKVEKTLKGIGLCIYIFGFIAGFIAGKSLGIDDANSRFDLSNALLYWFSAIVSGTIFLGFAEIISLLEKKLNRTHKYKLMK